MPLSLQKRQDQAAGKLQRTVTMNSEGIGLGLHIVDKIVKLVGGKIYVHPSGPGLGSLFFFSIAMPIATIDDSLEPSVSIAIIDSEDLSQQGK